MAFNGAIIMITKKTDITTAFFLFVWITFFFTSCQGHDQHSTLEKPFLPSAISKGEIIQKKGTKIVSGVKPQLIVMPLRPAKGQTYNGVGLGVHFLLGNMVAHHNGLKEFWFGWRVKKIFHEKNKFLSYCHGEDNLIEISSLSRGQGIRYWLWGWFKQMGSNVKVSLVLTDTEERRDQKNAEFIIKTSGKIKDFQKKFFSWLEDCGIEILDRQITKALWSEDTNMEGLDFLGGALEAYYIYSSWEHEKQLDMRMFNKAVSAAPHSYLAHDLRAWALYRKKEYREARKGFKSALKFNKNGLGALSGLMWCAIKTNDEKSAIFLGAEKSKVRMENVSIGKSYAAIRMGNIAYKENDYARAVGLYEKAVMWNPEKAAYLSKLALAYSNTGEFIRALDLLDHGLKIFDAERDKENLLTSKADVFYNLSMSLRKQGKYMEAINSLEKALAIDEIYRLKKAADDHRVMGSIFDRIGDHKRALENYRKSKEMEIKIDTLKR